MELRAEVAFTRPSLSEIKTKKCEYDQANVMEFALFSACPCEFDLKIS